MVLLAMMGLLMTAFFMRSLVGFDVSKDRVLYRENAEGRIENVYSLKIMNKDQRDHTYLLEATGLPDLKLQGKREIKVAAGEIFSQPVELSSAPEKLPSSTNEVIFILKDADDDSVHIEAKSRFIGPQVR
jgi:Ubp3 associated protein Bre5.